MEQSIKPGTKIAVFIHYPDGKKWYLFPHEIGQFQFNLEGGCSAASFTTEWPYDHFLALTSSQKWPVSVEIDDVRRWYGVIDDLRPKMTDKGEKLEVTCSGWANWLECYTSYKIFYPYDDDTSRGYHTYLEVVEELLEDVITDGYIAGIDATSDKELDGPINFLEQDYVQAMDYLALVAGDLAWGVDENRRFFFYPKPDNTGYHAIVGGNVTEYWPVSSSAKIVNSVLIKGGMGQTTWGEDFAFFAAIDDVEPLPGEAITSIDRYGRRREALTLNEIIEGYGAQRFADMLFNERRSPQLRASFKVANNDPQTFHPLGGKVHIYTPPDEHSLYRIISTNWTINDSGIQAEPQMGLAAPSIASELKRQAINDDVERRATYSETYPREWDANPDAGYIPNLVAVAVFY